MVEDKRTVRLMVSYGYRWTPAKPEALRVRCLPTLLTIYLTHCKNTSFLRNVLFSCDLLKAAFSSRAARNFEQDISCCLLP